MQSGLVQSVLIIDDHQQIRELLRDILEGEGLLVVEAADGREAIEIARYRHLDLLVTDLIMPEMEGIETILAIRSFRPDIGIIAISGAAESYLQAAKLLGADFTLRKPFSPSAIREAVRKVNSKLQSADTH